MGRPDQRGGHSAHIGCREESLIARSGGTALRGRHDGDRQGHQPPRSRQGGRRPAGSRRRADAKGDYEVASRSTEQGAVPRLPQGPAHRPASSPLAGDAQGYIKRLHGSTAFQAVSRARGRRTPPAAPPTDRPLRLLVTTSANANFLHHILALYEDHPRSSSATWTWLPRGRSSASRGPGASCWRTGWPTARPTTRRTSRRLMPPHLDWADTVFLDWSVGPAAMLTHRSRRHAHRRAAAQHEAFTRWPHMTDFSRVDDLIFVAPHVRDLVTSLVPQLRSESAPRMHLLDNAMELSASSSQVRGRPLQPRPDRSQSGRQGSALGRGRAQAGS